MARASKDGSQSYVATLRGSPLHDPPLIHERDHNHVLQFTYRSSSLEGIGFAHFAAFLSRSYRENDYLLGRLHAMDRLIDIVCDSAGADATAGIDVTALKKSAFSRVLDAEEKHLSQSHDLIADLRRCVAEIGR